MIVLLSESAGKGKQGEKHVSSFSGIRYLYRQPCGYGNCGSGYRHRYRRSRSHFLDVGHRMLGASSAFIELP